MQNNGATPCHVAAQYDKLGSLKLLIDKGADKDRPDVSASTTSSLIHEPRQQSHDEKRRYVLTSVVAQPCCESSIAYQGVPNNSS